MKTTNVIAVDLGASSGRLISGSFDGKKIELAEQFRFSNLPVQVVNDLQWDYIKILQEIKYGLGIANRDLSSIDSLSIDTWGVDYGLLNRRGQLLYAPHSYRDPRVEQFEAKLYSIIDKKTLFTQTGNQPDKINTILQLFSDLQLNPELKQEISHVLFMPNLISYFLTGKYLNEFTISSTSGLLDATTRSFSPALFEKLGFDLSWFGDVSKQGTVLGTLLPDITREINLRQPVKVITSVGHDTAAALLALPIDAREREQTAFISSGTWSIVGTQTPSPVANDSAFNNGLTNEGCFDGSNRLLRNITGLWIIQELQREWSNKGKMIDFGKMVEMASSTSTNSYIDPNDASFALPNQMEEKIIDYLRRTNQDLPEAKGELIRIVIESLAFTYRQVLDDLAVATNQPIKKVYMFGGGIQNELLVQLTADFTGKEVITGPIEASVLGNIASQLLTLNLVDAKNMHEIMKASYTVQHIHPQPCINLSQKYTTFQSVSRMIGN